MGKMGYILDHFKMDGLTAQRDIEIHEKERGIPHLKYLGITLGQQLIASGRRFMVVASRLDNDGTIYGYWIQEMSDQPCPPVFRLASQIEQALKERKLRFT